MDTSADKKTCYVVMGFGKKTDFVTGRVLDLDKSYRNVIKPAVEAAGLECVRADEIIHSGVIDVPMFKHLATADLVIADLSTSNANALYELGVRHALRPHGTIIIAETQFKYPFNINSAPILQYEHLGEDLGYREVMRFRAALTDAINARLAQRDQLDSPVYTFLSTLHAPSFESEPAAAAAAPPQTTVPAGGSKQSEPPPSPPDVTLADLLERAEAALKAKDFAAALSLFEAASGINPNNSTITQRRVLTISKSRQPDPVSALSEARRLLESLSPRTNADPETVSLLGDIEFSLYEAGQGIHHLINARQAFERLYANKPDWHRGIMLAYLVAQGAARQPDPEERSADLVIARRLWRDVIELGKSRLVEINALRQVEKFLPEAPDPAERALEEARILSAVAEAYFGLGDFDSYENERSRIAWAPKGEGVLKSLEARVQALGHLMQGKTVAPAGGDGGMAVAAGDAPSSRRERGSAGKPGAKSVTSVPYEAVAPANPNGPAAEPASETGMEVFISYAWGDESEAIADTLDKEFQRRQVVIVRDKRDLKFKGRIKAFMERIGRGKSVVLVISKKYLESPNCWYELLRVAENGDFYERVFPVVLQSARIYEPVERLRYVQFWEQKQRELDEALKNVSAANLHGFREEIDLYTEIREHLPKLTDVLKDMNTLTPEIHRETNFQELYEAVMEKLSH